MITIPKRLMELDFRFYLLGKGSKIPQEKLWNSKNNYPYFHSKLIAHLKKDSNYGICTGYGNLIIIDFDDYDFYKGVRNKLPYTFTVTSAGKRCPHYYYILEGEMFKKIGINDDKKNRICDIQADRCGIVAPNSYAGRKYYDVHNDKPIAKITFADLKAIFPTIEEKRNNHTEWTGKNKSDNEAVIVATEILKYHKILQTGSSQYKCPFHPSSNGKCLTILDDGSLWCFHCETYWYDIHKFVDELIKYRNNK